MKISSLLFLSLILALPAAGLNAQLPNFTKPDCDGNTVDLYSDLAAGNVVILNFCAGWCGPCRLADPLLEEVYQQTCANQAGIKVYGMLYQDNDAQPTDCAFANAYAAEYSLNFPLIADCEDVFEAYEAVYEVNAIPSFFIIVPNTADPASSDVYIQVGFIESLADDILGLLNSLGYPVGLSIEKTGEFCSDEPYAVLTSSLAEGNHWSTGETTRSITVTTPGTYTVDNEGLCGPLSASVVVDFTTSPQAGTVSASSEVVCADETFYLASEGAQAAYAEWVFTIAGDPGQIYGLGLPVGPEPVDLAIPDDFGGYVIEFFVAALNFYGEDYCLEFSNKASVSLPLLTGEASISSAEVCLGEAFTLEYVSDQPLSGAVWQMRLDQNNPWEDIGPADAGPLPVSLNEPGEHTFRVKAFDPGLGCHAYQIAGSIYVWPTSAYIDAPPCVVKGTSATLELVGYDPAYPVTWSTGDRNTGSITVSPESTTTYSVTFTDLSGRGCEVTLYRELVVEVVEVGTLSASTNLVMVGEPLILDYSGGTNFFAAWEIRPEGDPNWYWLEATVAELNPLDIWIPDTFFRSLEFRVTEVAPGFDCAVSSNVVRVFVIDENDIDPKHPDKVILCLDNGIKSRRISVNRESAADLLFNNPNAHLGPCSP